jgi:hypothetical protein
MLPLVSIRRYRAIIACIFAAAILTVIACDIVCGFDRTFISANHGTFASLSHQKEIAKSGHHQHDESHDHNHRHGDAEDPQVLTNHSHSTSSSEEDDCCEDMTNQLFKSSFKDQETLIIKAPAQAFVLLDVLYSQPRLIVTDYSNPVRVPPKIYFNLTGNRLRILLNSFLI